MTRPAKRTKRRRNYHPAEWALLEDLAEFLVKLNHDGKLDDIPIPDEGGPIT